MGSFTNAVLIDSVYTNSERPLGTTSARAQSILPNAYTIPKPIVDYVQGFSTTLTPDGAEILPNVPPLAIPLTSYEDDDGNVIPSGTYGPVTAETHNVYECYVCPYTTAQRVILSRQAHPPAEWDPLPEHLMPEGGMPNANFIGYGPLTPLHPDARDAITRGGFEEGDNVAGRLRINATLFGKCTEKMNSLSRRFKMIKLSSSLPIVYKTQPANLVFSRTSDEVQEIGYRPVMNMSSYQFGTNAAGAAGIYTAAAIYNNH